MRIDKSIPVVYERDSLSSLAKLRQDQQAHIDSLIAFMRGSAFGTAILEPPFSEKIAFHPSVEDPKQAQVTIGPLRVRIARDVEAISVTAKKR